MATKKRSSKTRATRKSSTPATRRKTVTPRKGAAKKGAAKKGAAKKGAGRKYSETASKKVGRAMHEMKRGRLRSGGSKKKVTNPKQAIAIGLSEARSSGAKVPKPRRSR